MITAGITIAITLFQWLLALAIIKHKAWARVAGILYGLLLIALFNVFTTPLGVLLLIGLTKGWAAENPAPETQ
jgi:hypothetical protein